MGLTFLPVQIMIEGKVYNEQKKSWSNMLNESKACRESCSSHPAGSSSQTGRIFISTVNKLRAYYERTANPPRHVCFCENKCQMKLWIHDLLTAVNFKNNWSLYLSGIWGKQEINQMCRLWKTYRINLPPKCGHIKCVWLDELEVIMYQIGLKLQLDTENCSFLKV